MEQGTVFDVLVVGGGLAGWRAAEAAASSGVSVALVANGAGNSPDIHALNVPVGPGDSVERYIDDTIRSGRGACDPALVEVLCRGALALADEFPWDRNPDGSFGMLQPVGCSVPRCVSIGHHIGAWALAKIKRELDGKVEVFHGRVTTLRLEDGVFHAKWTGFRATGDSGAARALSVRAEGGRRIAQALSARAVVLATGGWCGKYVFSDNPPELRGDGIKMAQALGAAVRDMDAVQYEPTVALAPAFIRGIPVITTMLHEGATFRNCDGKEFLPDKHANKDELSRAIFAEIAAGHGVPDPLAGAKAHAGAKAQAGVWFDATGVDPSILRSRYADTVRRYEAVGVDITREPMLVSPAPHTSLGGVVIDPRCRVLRADSSPISGLFAAGEITGGVHGLNRIGGSAGTEVLVFGRIAGAEAAAYASEGH